MIDMAGGYWHVKLTEKSSYLCTFNTPWGRMTFCRMPFGILSASEIMHKRNQEAFSDIPGMQVIADKTVEEHDQILHKVMQRARQQQVKFNRTKVEF